MKVIKSPDIKYDSFYASLPLLSKVDESTNKTLFEDTDLQLQSKNLLQNALKFYSDLNKAASIDAAKKLLSEQIRKEITFSEAEFFLLDSTGTILKAPGKSFAFESNTFVNNAYKEGIIDWAFDTQSPKIIPVYKSSFLSTNGKRYLIFPLFEGTERKGIFSILHNYNIDLEDDVVKFTELIAGFAFQKINILIKDEEKKSAFNTLQSYQSKLINDYRLSAVGELAGGVVEEILEPLQVIYSSLDLLHPADNNNEIVEGIKQQVRKIESSSARLRRFVDRTDSKIKIIPCEINSLITNYYSIASSSLEKKQIECILDLEKDLPSILSHPHLVNQLFINLVNIITEDLTRQGGIIIQTRFVKDCVKFTLMSTEFIPLLKNPPTVDPTFTIVNQLVAKHEGKMKTSSELKLGSRIEIFFPLKRKIRS